MKLLLASLLAAVLHCLALSVVCRRFEGYTAGFSFESASASNTSLAAAQHITHQKISQNTGVDLSRSHIVNRLKSSFTRRNLLGYQGTNPVDECWRGDHDWAHNRVKLANCAIGFGSNAIGGRDGEIYVVTDHSDDAVDPSPGTLRYGVIQLYPLWIIFQRDMTITLMNELILTSHKTIDGRGTKVHIAYGPCITIQEVSNVIIHGLNIHNCQPGRSGMVRSSTVHVGHRLGSDGDAITVFGARDIWIDHNSLSSCYDGLIDVTYASTAVTITNNWFYNHDKVMLLGHNDHFTKDRAMRVTVAYNRFGPRCEQRMPRCRFGYFHIINNDYIDWGMYALGGSADPTIISEGNRFRASQNSHLKEVTKRDCSCGRRTWSDWTWRSTNDMFLNGAYFIESGAGRELRTSGLTQASTFVPTMTAAAGALSCARGSPC